MTNCHFDHQNFYINDQPFYLMASSNVNDTDCNTAVIALDCSNASVLDFNSSLNQAKLALSQNKYIIWDIHLGLEQSSFLIHDELYLKSILHSLKYFVDELYSLFKESSIGVVLYSGKMPEYESDLPTSLNKNGFDQSYLKQLHDCGLLTDYLRLIAPNIPDELSMIIKFDVSDIGSPSHLLHLLSKERFEYFLLALKGSNVSVPAIKWEKGKGNLGQIDCEHSLLRKISTVGVCFASNGSATKAEFDQFDRIFQELSSMNIDFRILEEEFATEQWDGLDYIIVRKKSLSLHGKRMLQGFCAASGIAVYHDMPVGVLNEISFEDFEKDVSGVCSGGCPGRSI